MLPCPPRKSKSKRNGYDLFRSGRTMLAHGRISKSCKRRQYSLGPCNGKSSQLKRVFRMTDLRTKNKSVYRPVLKETHRSTDSQQPQITAAMAVEEGESGARRAKRPAQAGQRDGRFPSAPPLWARRRGHAGAVLCPSGDSHRRRAVCWNRFPAVPASRSSAIW